MRDERRRFVDPADDVRGIDVGGGGPLGERCGRDVGESVAVEIRPPPAIEDGEAEVVEGVHRRSPGTDDVSNELNP